MLFLSNCSISQNSKRKDDEKIKNISILLDDLAMEIISDIVFDQMMEIIIGDEYATNLSQIMNYTSTSISLIKLFIDLEIENRKIKKEKYLLILDIIDCYKCEKDGKNWNLKFDLNKDKRDLLVQKIQNGAELIDVLISRDFIKKDFFEKDIYTIDDMNYFWDAIGCLHLDTYFTAVEDDLKDILNLTYEFYKGYIFSNI